MQERKTKLKKVVFISDHHICFNPRVWKEAFYYEKRGIEVVILSMWIGRAYLEKDLSLLRGHNVIYKSYLNLIPGESGIMARLFYRMRKRMLGELQRVFGIGFQGAISYSPGRMFQSALRENADHYSAHLECALATGKKLMKKGKNVSFDFEDWYSDDFLVPERPVKLLRSLEQSALEKGLFCTCTSVAMKKSLQDAYGDKGTLEVIYNGFPFEEGKGSKEQPVQSNDKKIQMIWFSRSVGPDRGIEPFLKSISGFNQFVELHFLGKMEPGYDAILEGFQRGNKTKLVVHPFIDHSQLIPFIDGFDLGLAIDVKVNRNRDVTITNKILQYLQAGLPVLASDTAGHREVAAYFPGRVRVVDINDPGQVADVVMQLKDVKPGLTDEEQKCFDEVYSWEAQEKKLEGLVGRYFEI